VIKNENKKKIKQKCVSWYFTCFANRRTMSSHDEEHDEEEHARLYAKMIALAITTRTRLEESGEQIPQEQSEFEKRLNLFTPMNFLPEDLVRRKNDAVYDCAQLADEELSLLDHKYEKFLGRIDKQMSELDAFREAGASEEACLNKKHQLQDQMAKKNAKTLAGTQKCEVCPIFTSSRCEKCKQVYYCSKECQVGDWKLHKPACKKHRKAQQAST